MCGVSLCCNEWIRLGLGRMMYYPIRPRVHLICIRIKQSRICDRIALSSYLIVNGIRICNSVFALTSQHQTGRYHLLVQRQTVMDRLHRFVESRFHHPKSVVIPVNTARSRALRSVVSGRIRPVTSIMYVSCVMFHVMCHVSCVM